MKAWHLIEQQPWLKEIFKDLPLICYTERAVSQRYTRESQIIKKALKTRTREQCRPVTLVPNVITCDNPGCPIEWFHFECMGLVDAPSRKRLYTECAV